MKKSLLAVLILAVTTAVYAEPAKKPVAKAKVAKVEKKVETPKDLGKKPTPKKKIN